MPRKNKRFISLVIFIIVVVLIFTIAVIFKIIGQVLKTSDYFKIKYIFVNGIETTKIDLEKLRNSNIFTADLKKVANDLAKDNPAFFKISVRRRLPDELHIDFKERRPLARVRLFGRFLLVDGQKVFFNLTADYPEAEVLPLITGLESSISNIEIGSPHDSRELNLALDLIAITKDNNSFKDYKIDSINAPNLDNFSFFIKGLEIKIGPLNYRSKLDILAQLLVKLKDKLGTIRYIDLRFRDPIVKMKARS